MFSALELLHCSFSWVGSSGQSTDQSVADVLCPSQRPIGLFHFRSTIPVTNSKRKVGLATRSQNATYSL